MNITEQRWDARLSVNSLSSRQWTLWEDLECYERLGIGRFSLFLPKLRLAGIDVGVEEIKGRGLKVDSILPGATFDLLDERSWSQSQESLIMGIELAQRLSATSVQTTGGSAGGFPYEVAAERFSRAIAPVATVAAAAGIRLALEPTRPQFAHIGFVHTVRDALELVTELGLWLVPDTAHSWWEAGVADLLRRSTSRIAVIQVADLAFDAPVLERRVPGDGSIALGSFLGAALEGGFNGPFELELLGGAIESEGYESAISRSLAYLTGVMAGLD